MKTMLMTVAMLAASVAFAKVDVEALSWGQILKRGSQYGVTGDRIVFNNPQGFGITYKASTDKEVCMNADNTVIYGGNSKVWISTGNDDSDGYYETIKLVQPVAGYKYKCNTFVNDDDGGAECKDSNLFGKYWDRIPFTQTAQRSVTVTTKPREDANGNTDFKVLGVKAYTIPVCPWFSAKAN